MTHDNVDAEASGNAAAISARASEMTVISNDTMKLTIDVTPSVRHAAELISTSAAFAAP